MTRMAIHRISRGFGATVILVGTILAVIPAPMATPSAHALAWAVAIDKDGFHPQG